MIPEKRWMNGNGYINNPFFYRAIQKYGWNNITHEIIADGLTSKEATAKERKMIAQYQANNTKYGYNLTDGGEEGKHYSEVSKAKMSASKKGMYSGMFNPRFGKTCSEETKQRISNALRGKFSGEKNPNYGKPMSESQKRLISEKRKGKHYPKLADAVRTSNACIMVREKQKRPIAQYTKDGEYIQTWDSAADASVELIGHRRGQSNICSCANGKLGSAYGYIWKHVS